MEIAESLANDLQNKIEMTEDMIHQFEQTSPQKVIELRGRLYAIQVLLNEIEEEYVEMALTLN